MDRVDKIIVMDKGRILHQGSFDELRHLEYFQTILDHMRKEDIGDDEESKQIVEKPRNDLQNCSQYRDQIRKSYLNNRGTRITTDENKEVTKVGWKIYFKYLTYTKWTVVTITLTILVIILKRLSDILFDYYILTWIRDISETRHNHWDLFGLVLTLAGLVTVTALLTGLIQIGFIFSISLGLFRNMITRVCHAPVNMYFDITPTGVILNRFSKDIQTVEMVLPFTVRAQMINYVTIISGIAIAAYNVIWVLVCIPFMLLACYFLLKYYSKALKETSRLESVSSSPIITHIGETISGISTVRTYQKADDFLNKQDFLQDQNVACQLLRRGVKGWFNTRVSLVLILFMAFTFVY